jgi:hypothetical protein
MKRELDGTLKFRAQKDLIKAFQDACARNDTTAAQVIRAAMRQFVKDNAQGDLLTRRKK